MIDTKKFATDIQNEADSGARREAEKVARDTLRLCRDGRSKPVYYAKPVERKSRTPYIDIEGATLKFGSRSRRYRDGWDAIFGKRCRQ